MSQPFKNWKHHQIGNLVRRDDHTQAYMRINRFIGFSFWRFLSLWLQLCLILTFDSPSIDQIGRLDNLIDKKQFSRKLYATQQKINQVSEINESWSENYLLFNFIYTWTPKHVHL